MPRTPQETQSEGLIADANSAGASRWGDRFTLRFWLYCCLLMWFLGLVNWLAQLNAK